MTRSLACGLVKKWSTFATASAATFAALAGHGRPDLFEVGTPPWSPLSKEVAHLGGVSWRFGPHNGHDLATEEGAVKIVAAIRQHRPKNVWLAVPCGEQKMLAQKRHRSEKMLANALVVATEALKLGANVHDEYPSYHDSRETPTRRTLREQLHEARFDGCTASVRTSEGKLIRKSWTILTSSERMAEVMNKRRGGGHAHANVKEGSWASTDFYPKAMVKKIATVIMEKPRYDGLYEET